MRKSCTITEEIKDNFHNYDDSGNRFLSGGSLTDDPIEPMTNDDPESAIEPDNSTMEQTKTIEVEVITDDDHNTDDDHKTDTDNDHDNNGNGYDKTRLTPSELAKRLGLKSHHEVTQKFKSLNKNGFIMWSINNDPDKHGWYKVDGKYQIVA